MCRLRYSQPADVLGRSPQPHGPLHGRRVQLREAEEAEGDAVRLDDREGLPPAHSAFASALESQYSLSLRISIGIHINLPINIVRVTIEVGPPKVAVEEEARREHEQRVACTVFACVSIFVFVLAPVLVLAVEGTGNGLPPHR